MDIRYQFIQLSTPQRLGLGIGLVLLLLSILTLLFTQMKKNVIRRRIRKLRKRKKVTSTVKSPRKHILTICLMLLGLAAVSIAVLIYVL